MILYGTMFLKRDDFRMKMAETSCWDLVNTRRKKQSN
jgi:hypothetical protein